MREENAQTLFKRCRQALKTRMDEGEAVAIAFWLLEDLWDLTKPDILAGKPTTFSTAQESRLEKALARLANGEPIQHILGYAWFLGRKFDVNQHVLIPRQETEELVQWVLADTCSSGRVLDVGTGSGVIPVSLKLEREDLSVAGWDISSQALRMATHNAARHKVDVDFALVDIMGEHFPDEVYDVIVSNPPYIPVAERETMARNVTEFDPEMALFVPDDDPFRFYKAIATFARTNLTEKGLLFFEIHERSAETLTELLEAYGFSITEVRQDLNGKDRMLKAER